MQLNFDGLYRITCKRIKEGEAIGQAGPFSLMSALQEGYFTDVIIKSSDGLYVSNIINHGIAWCPNFTSKSIPIYLSQFEAHSVILRLNGFDCSMNFKSDLLPNASTDSAAAVAVMATAPGAEAAQSTAGVGAGACAHPSYLATNHFLLPPPSTTGCLAKKGLTGSFNCLSSSPNLLSPPNAFTQNNHHHHHHHHHGSNSSSSDSDIRQSCNNRKEVFNFDSTIIRSTPMSPRCTPPSSPLTPISILYNLPCSMLKPIIYWLYTESIPSSLSEEVCEKLLALSDQTPPLNKMTNPCRRYLKNLRLKKCKFKTDFRFPIFY